MPTIPKDDPDSKLQPINLYLPRALLRRLTAVAKAVGRSRSALMRHWLQENIEEYEQANRRKR